MNVNTCEYINKMSASFLSAASIRTIDAKYTNCTTMRPAAASRPPRVLCFGDSLTAGYTALTKYNRSFAPWAPHLADALGIAVDHVGMCGCTTTQMLDGLDREANVDVCEVSHRGLRLLLEEGSYTHVLLMAGTNDIKVHSASEIAQSLVRLHGVCHVAGARTLALAIPHCKACSPTRSRDRCERRREVNERLAAFAAGSHGWCEFTEPGREVQQWEEGSMHFEQDGLHLSRSGYAFFAWLLLRGTDLRGFLKQHTAFHPQLLRVPDEIVAWRRQMRVWMEQHKMAVESVQDLVMDAQMAKVIVTGLPGLAKLSSTSRRASFLTSPPTLCLPFRPS